MHLVGPFADFDRGFAGGGSEDARDGRAMREQMRKKAMLLEQALAIAHRAVMALDEDAWSRFQSRSHDAGRGKRARAYGENARRARRAREIRARRARSSSSVSGGQSGATSVPSMPWAFERRSLLTLGFQLSVCRAISVASSSVPSCD